MPLRLSLTINMDAEDPSNPEAETLALSIAAEEGQAYGERVRQRLVDAGVTISSFSMNHDTDD